MLRVINDVIDYYLWSCDRVS